MDEKVYVTEKGLQDLKDKLNYLKTVKRVEASEKIGEARKFGDLSENSEYDAAKDEQALIEAEIMELEAKIKVAQIIDPKKINTSKVNIGCKVIVFDEDLNQELTYKLVGDTESNPEEGLISNISPVGKALMGKKIGETVEVEAPYGVIKMKILKIKV